MTVADKTEDVTGVNSKDVQTDTSDVRNRDFHQDGIISSFSYHPISPSSLPQSCVAKAVVPCQN